MCCRCGISGGRGCVGCIVGFNARAAGCWAGLLEIDANDRAVAITLVCNPCAHKLWVLNTIAPTKRRGGCGSRASSGWYARVAHNGASFFIVCHDEPVGAKSAQTLASVWIALTIALEWSGGGNGACGRG